MCGAGDRSTIIGRSLSCYTCDECLSTDDTIHACTNTETTGDFRPLLNTSCRQVDPDDETGTEAEDNTCDIRQLLATGLVVAVQTEDPNYEYYLLSITKTAYKLRKDCTDSWGATYRQGCHVICGNYYDKMERHADFEYRLLKRKAVVPLSSVVHICSEITSSDMIVIPEELHLCILDKVDAAMNR